MKPIVLTNHVREKNIPDFEVKNILEKNQGKLFYDSKRESFVQVKGKTVVVYKEKFDYDHGEEIILVVTCYRKGSPHKFKNDRFREITAA